MSAAVEKRRIPLLLFLTCLLASLAVRSGHHYSIDGMLMFQSAKALAFRGTLRLDPPLVWGTRTFPASHYGIGLTALYVPVLRLVDLTVLRNDPRARNMPSQAGVPYNKALLTDPAYRYASLLHPLILALAAVLLYRLALRLGFSVRLSAAAALMYGLASPALPYSRFDFSQPLCALLLLGAFYGLAAAQGGERPRRLALAGACAGMLVLVRAEFLLLGFALLLAAVFWNCAAESRGTRAMALAAYSLSATPFLAALFALNRLRFGSWLASGYPSGKFAAGPLRPLIALAGNLASPGRGLLVFFPAALFCLFCWPRVRKSRMFAVMLASVAAALLFYSAWGNWGAGISWGPRFMVPWLPLVALLALAGFTSPGQRPGRGRTAALILLLALGAAFALQGCLFDYLPFYNRILKTGVDLNPGDYLFIPRFSPLASGWSGLLQPARYDILWLRSAGAGSAARRMPLFFAAALLALAVSWLKFFLRAPAAGDRSRGN